MEQHKKQNVFDVEKNKVILEEFDLKLEQYKRALNDKMEAFDPLQFNLMEKDYFFTERDNLYKMLRQRC